MIKRINFILIKNASLEDTEFFIADVFITIYIKYFFKTFNIIEN